MCKQLLFSRGKNLRASQFFSVICARDSRGTFLKTKFKSCMQNIPLKQNLKSIASMTSQSFIYLNHFVYRRGNMFLLLKLTHQVFWVHSRVSFTSSSCNVSLKMTSFDAKTRFSTKTIIYITADLTIFNYFSFSYMFFIKPNSKNIVKLSVRCHQTYFLFRNSRLEVICIKQTFTCIKQPPKVFCKKRCSQKFRKIHRKTPVPESLF